MRLKILDKSLLASLLLSTTVSMCQAKDDWSQKPANLSTSEYIDLFFSTSGLSHKDIFNSAIASVVHFWPSDIPKNAVVEVFVIHDKDPGKNLLATNDDGAAAIFKSCLEYPSIKKRWPGATAESNLIIHHFKSNPDEFYSLSIAGREFKIGEAHGDSHTLAVRLNGKTCYDKPSFEQAETKLKRAGSMSHID